MHVIGHQDTGMDLNPVFHCNYLTIVHLALIIGVREKTGFAIMTALDDMLGDARQDKARFA
jgi:hypothetical protein